MRETRNLEFKESITDSFLKTVSAFANYGGGRILFGVNDEGEAVGCGNAFGPRGLTDAALCIENKINDAITPQPEFEIELSEKTGVITLSVFGGASKPYYYRSRAYRRSDSSSVAVDALELSRLVLEGSNRSFDGVPSSNQDLSFATLQEWAKEKIGIASITADALKTLELSDVEGVLNNAAALVADDNEFSGVDMVEFGETINIIKDRRTVEGVSVLRQYDEAMKMWADHCTYEQIEGATRKTVEMVPKEAFREAVANALAHRTWDVNAHVRISVFKDRVEVASPGGLPAGITEDEYLSGRVSLFRNPILGNLLFRLGVIERFGTGVTRIREAYREQGLLPRFDILPNSILVSLPFINEVPGLSKSERMVYEHLSENVAMSNPQLADEVGFGLTKTRAVLERLVELGYARKVGAGRGTRYLR